ncbi:MAG: AAA family ATPase [Acidimicrobiales bacterium]
MERSELVGQCWQDFDDVLVAGISRILLYGPPGTGKTYGALHYGVIDGGVERLICTEDLTSGEIMGTWMPSRDGRFEWREGPAIRAWRGVAGEGGRLVVDEIDRASGDALSTLLAVTDSPESAKWRNPDTLEWVRPGRNFSVVMTSNVEELDDIPAALRDRFPVSVRIDRPHPSALANLSTDLHGPAMFGSLGPSDRRISLRMFYAFDDLRRNFGSDAAARLIFGSDGADAVLDALSIGRVS